MPAIKSFHKFHSHTSILFHNLSAACGLDSDSGLGPVLGSCEHGNESLGSMKGRKLLEQLSDYDLLKKESGPWS
jgi:hypothetical protein